MILPNSDPLIVHWRRLRLLWGLSGLKADICFIISHQKGTASEAAREGGREGNGKGRDSLAAGHAAQLCCPCESPKRASIYDVQTRGGGQAKADRMNQIS